MRKEGFSELSSYWLFPSSLSTNESRIVSAISVDVLILVNGLVYYGTGLTGGVVASGTFFGLVSSLTKLNTRF
jgi:hypothetical protein